MLLRQLIQRIGNLAGALLLLLGLTAFIQQLAADLENFLIQRVGRHSRRHAARLVTHVV
ncbi:Uncharacterised protein [Shigella sonnei]|nr:Uncharacterised protein [Shigella sonnei]